MPFSKTPPTVPGIDLGRIKAVIFSRDGRLLWRSAGWDGKPLAPVHEVEQYRWKEFVFVSHIPKLLAWLAEKTPGEPFHFNSNTPQGWARFTFVKLPYGKYWLCIGDMEPSPPPQPESHERKTNPDHRPLVGSDPFIP